MQNFITNCFEFIKKETVLSAAFVLAIISAFLVPPNADYITYIDWNTLALLFSLMAVMKGFQKAGVFVYLANLLLKKTDTSRKMMYVLVFLPFIFSMVITNDVSLITFVPFAVVVLKLAKQEKLIIPLVIMQTLAANLGSMLTPMGNPQNLYLYAKSGLGFTGLLGLMLPYVLLSAISLVVLVFFTKSSPIPPVSVDAKLSGIKPIFYSSIGLIICLFGIFKIVPPLAIAALTAVFLIIFDRKLLTEIDYSLLGTFVFFFIFVGNIGAQEDFKNIIAALLSDNTEIVAVLASQIISNVPAALLLSGFTDQWNALIIGCNIGGLGTLIASMASLISYKIVAKEYPELRKEYLVKFTLYNILLLVILLLASFILTR